MRRPNWYLHPLVAEQKRAVHLDWIRRNVQEEKVAVVLKTDLFEEAHGQDELLFSLPFAADLKIGIDVVEGTVHLAGLRWPSSSRVFMATDTRRLPLQDCSVDVVLSNSTLDHFSDARDIKISIREMVRVLKPGGALLITLDNPQNPLYVLFRAGAQRFSYPLGRTVGRRELEQMMGDAGVEVVSTDWLIHNPRFLSTLLFLVLGRMPAPFGDRLISAFLRLFSGLGRLPTRPFTAAFVAACGRKPVQGA